MRDSVDFRGVVLCFCFRLGGSIVCLVLGVGLGLFRSGGIVFLRSTGMSCTVFDLGMVDLFVFGKGLYGRVINVVYLFLLGFSWLFDVK